MSTSPAEPLIAETPAPVAPTPVPAVKRTRSRSAAPKSAEVVVAAEMAAAESVPVAVPPPAAKRAPRKTAVPVKAVTPAVRKPVRKVADIAPARTVLEVPASTKADKPDASRKRDKLVRDSFTMPKSEYALLADLKQRATALARPAKKSELLRAGIKALAAMGDTAFLAALYDVPALKTGRPAAQEVSSPKAKAGKTGERRGD